MNSTLSNDFVGLGVGLGFFLLFGTMILSALGLFALWIWMLVDCAQSPEPPGNTSHRVTWVLILVFTSWLGAVLYYFIVRRPREAARRSRHFTSPPMPPRMHT